MRAFDGFPAPASPPARPRPRKGLLRSLSRLAGGYWTGSEKKRAAALSITLVSLGMMQVGLAIWTNYWSAEFFDALERKSMERFLIQIGVFGLIVLGGMATSSAHLQVIHLRGIGRERPEP